MKEPGETGYEGAFPSHIKLRNSDKDEPFAQYVNHGLSKREYFAGLAMQGLLAAVYSDKKMLDEFTKVEYSPRPRGIGEGEYRNGRESISTNAVVYADALIAALEKNED